VTTYEIRLGRRPIATRRAPSAQEAVFDYVKSFGCANDEISRVAANRVAWRGAVFTAVPAEERPEAAV
jgi:hypothetical protein